MKCLLRCCRFFAMFFLFMPVFAEKMQDFVFKAPESLPNSIINRINENKSIFFDELKEVLASEKDDLLILVDKKHLLSEHYVPKNLVPLTTGKAYTINKKGLMLTGTAESALRRMAEAARKEGITLDVSSSYRTYAYQKNLFARYVREYGEKQAETFSARAGTSQHQLGTAVDFGSVSDDYARTKACKWLSKNAEKYGWSLSFPKGYDAVTGYKWECWHFRYIGVTACRFQKKWFNDIQQYMLEFIDEWKKTGIKNL